MMISVEQQVAEVTSIAVLPCSVIARILSLVQSAADRNRVAQVCRGFRLHERQSRWSLIVRAEQKHLGMLPLCFSNVTELDLSALILFPGEFPSFHVDKSHQLRLARAFPKVKTLKAMTVSDDSVREIGCIWPRIRNISFTRQALVNPPRLKTVLETFTHCEVLDARNLPCDSLITGLSGTESLALKSVNLETLVITNDQEIEVLARKCPRLEKLCVTIHMGRMIGDGFLKLATNCRKLIKLRLFLYVDIVTQFNAEIARKSLIFLARMASELPDMEIHLSLQHIPSIVTGHRMDCLLAMATSIRSLVVYNTDASMNGVWSCSNMTELTLGACESLCDDDLVALVKRCRKLITLRILNCKQITERGLKAVADIVKLNSISLCFLKIPVKAQLAAIKPLSRSLSAIRLMVNGPVDSLSGLGGWPNLTRLELTLTTYVLHNVLIEQWLGLCPKLKHVGIVMQHWCPSTLRFLLMLPSLPSLSLSFSSFVSKDFVLTFLEEITLLQHLSTLSLYVCNKEWLSEEAGELFARCPKLKSLKIVWMAEAFTPADRQFNIRPLLLSLLGMKCLKNVQLPCALADEIDLRIFYRGLHAHTVQSILKSVQDLQSRDGSSRKRMAVLHVRDCVIGDA